MLSFLGKECFTNIVQNTNIQSGEMDIDEEQERGIFHELQDSNLETQCENFEQYDNGINAKFLEYDKDSDDFILNLVLSLYGTSNLTRKHVNQIVHMFQQISEKTKELCINRIDKCSSIDEAQNLLRQHSAMDFSEYMTENNFLEKISKMNLYKEPIRFRIGSETIESIPGSLQNVSREVVAMNVEFQIKEFLQIDGMLDLILNNQRKLQMLPDGVYKNFVNSNSWKRISSNHQGKEIIPLFLYNDDFQVFTKMKIFFCKICI